MQDRHQRATCVEPKTGENAALLAARLHSGARKGDGHIYRHGFLLPTVHHSDHCTIVAVIRAGGEGGGLKKYRRKHQKLPLSLPLRPKDMDTTAFNALAAKCVNPKLTQKPGKDWMSEAMWRLIAKQAYLLQSGCIWQDATWRMKREIGATIKAVKQKLTAKVGNLIVPELAKGDIKKAFWHLKGWYRKAAETQARPCRQMMERQTYEWEEPYAKRACSCEKLSCRMAHGLSWGYIRAQ